MSYGYYLMLLCHSVPLASSSQERLRAETPQKTIKVIEDCIIGPFFAAESSEPQEMCFLLRLDTATYREILRKAGVCGSAD